MKKAILTIAFIASVGTAFAAESNWDIRGGASNSKNSSEKFGLDIVASYNYGADKYLTVGPEIGFQWLNYDQGTGQTVTFSTGQTGELTTSSNSFTFPVLASIKLRFDTGAFTPFVNLGVGYGYTQIRTTTPAYSGNGNVESLSSTDLSGLAYQGLLGTTINLGAMGGSDDWGGGSGSSLRIVLEGGYRGYKPKTNDGVQADFSGIVIRAGLQFSLGGGAVNDGF